MKMLRIVMTSAALSVALLTWIGCEGGMHEPTAEITAPATGGRGSGAPGPGGAAGAEGWSRTKAIMAKLNGGPAALDKAVAKALEPQEPDWASVQKQTTEYAKLASDFGKADPPKGSKDSWTQLTLAYSESAAE